MPIVVSPLHDKDRFSDEDEAENSEHKAGELKKKHHHAIISWGNPTTLNNALNTLRPFGINHVEPIGSYPGYCRYLCHLDDPDKAQYDPDDVVCFGGAVPDYERKLTDAEFFAQRDEIMALCEENGVEEYYDLCEFVRQHRPDWRADVYRHTVFWRGYFGSKRSRSATDWPVRAESQEIAAEGDQR